MTEPLKLPREHGGHAMFIDGYFSSRVWNGEEPEYGYPKNHLPETGEATMEVVTGFVAASKAKKKP